MAGLIAAVAAAVAVVAVVLLLRSRSGLASARSSLAELTTLLEAERTRAGLLHDQAARAAATAADERATVQAALDEALRQQDELAEDLAAERDHRDGEIARARAAQVALADEVRAVRQELATAEAAAMRAHEAHAATRLALTATALELDAERAAAAGTGALPADAAVVAALWRAEVRRAHRRWCEIVPPLAADTPPAAPPVGDDTAEQLQAVVAWTLARLREEAGTHTACTGSPPDLRPRAALVAALVLEELTTALARQADTVEVVLGTTEHGWLAAEVVGTGGPARWPDGVAVTSAAFGAHLHLDPPQGDRQRARLYVAP